MAADVIHRKLLNSWRHWLRAKGTRAQRRHIVGRHISRARRVGHDSLEEGGARFKQGDTMSLDGRCKATRVRE